MGSFSIWHWLMALMYLPLLAFYHAPTTVAIIRKSDKALIVQLINVFLGWTIIGWVIALIIALQRPKVVVA